MDLTPEAGPVTVHVTVTAPDEKNTQFQGSIRVVNTGNASDFALIPISLKTSLDTSVAQGQARLFLSHSIAVFTEIKVDMVQR